jgi:hypothetical protein
LWQTNIIRKEDMMENLPVVQDKRSPVEVLEEGRKSAQALMSVVNSKPKVFKVHGETYLEYEDWQLISELDGRGFTVKTHDAIAVEVDGIKGAKATADLIDRDGKILGGAEAYCMRDEDNWKTKPWFQLASMAQTRAGAKSLRNKFSFIAPLAGVKATPAEEMDGVNGEKKVESGVSEGKPAEAQHSPPKSVITPKQAGRFYAIAKSTKASDQDIKDWLAREYNLHSTKEVPIDLYDEICKRVVDELADAGSEG